MEAYEKVRCIDVATPANKLQYFITTMIVVLFSKCTLKLKMFLLMQLADIQLLTKYPDSVTGLLCSHVSVCE